MKNMLSTSMSVLCLFGIVSCYGLLNHEETTEAQCMALNIYHEARGESIEGQYAIAHVTLNRVASTKWPDSICDVVYQPYQFSWTHQIRDQKPKGNAWTVAKQAAALVLSGEHKDNTGGADHYHADYVNPYWSEDMDLTTTIGTHLFYKAR